MANELDVEKYRKIYREMGYPLLIEGTPLFIFLSEVIADQQTFRTSVDRGHIIGVTFMPESATALTIPDSSLDDVLITANLGGSELVQEQPASFYQYLNLQSLKRRKIPIGIKGGNSQTLNLTVTNSSLLSKRIQAQFFRKNPYEELKKFKVNSYGLKSRTFQLDMAINNPSFPVLNLDLPSGSGNMIGFSFTTSSAASVSDLLTSLIELAINKNIVIADFSILSVHSAGKYPQFFFPLWIEEGSTGKLSIPTVADNLEGKLSVTFYFDN